MLTRESIWFNQRSVVRFLSVLIVLGQAVFVSQSHARDWHTLKGQFYAGAELVDVRGGQVILKKSDGTAIAVDMKNLSPEDALFVQDALKQAVADVTSAAAAGVVSQPTKTAPEVKATIAEVPRVEFEYLSSSYARSLWPSPWVGGVARQGTLIQIANLLTGEKRKLENMEDKALEAALGGDGDVVAVWTETKKLQIYSVAQAKKLREIEVKDVNEVHAMFFANPRHLILRGGNSLGGFEVYDIEKEKLLCSLPSISGDEYCLSPDGKYLVMEREYKAIASYDLQTGNVVHEIPLPKDENGQSLRVRGFGFGKTPNDLIVLLKDTRQLHINFYDLEKGEQISTKVFEESLDGGYPLPPTSPSPSPAILLLADNKRVVIFGSVVANIATGDSWWLNPRIRVRETIYAVLLGDKLLCLKSPFKPHSELITIGAAPSKQETLTDSQNIGLPELTKAKTGAIKEIIVPENVPLFQSKMVEPLPLVKGKPVSFPADNDFSKKYFFAEGRTGKIFVHGDPKWNQAPLVIDAIAGTYQEMIDANYHTQLCDISPDGNWMAVKSGTKEEQIDIFDLRTCKHKISFRAFEGDPVASVIDIKFVSNEVLILMSAKSVAWDFLGAKPLYSIGACGQAARFPVSDHFMCYQPKHGRIVRKISDGTVVGKLEEPPDATADRSMGQSVKVRGDELACVAYDYTGHCVVWNLATGKIVNQFDLQSIRGANPQMTFDPIFGLTSAEEPHESVQSVEWANNGHLLVSWYQTDLKKSEEFDSLVHSLFSIKSQKFVWEYRRPRFSRWSIQDGLLWLVERPLIIDKKYYSSVVASADLTGGVSPKYAESGTATAWSIEQNDSVGLLFSVTGLNDLEAEEEEIEVYERKVAACLKENLVSVVRPKIAKFKLHVSIEHRMPPEGVSRDILVQLSLTDSSGKSLVQESKNIQDFETTPEEWMEEQARKLVRKSSPFPIGVTLISSQGEKILDVPSK